MNMLNGSNDVEIGSGVSAQPFDSGVVHINLNYPRNNGFKELGVFLVDVRAQGFLWIKYDFDKDKWIVEVEPLEADDKPEDMIEVYRRANDDQLDP